MKLDFSKIPSSVDSVEKLIVYLLLCLDRGIVNRSQNKGKLICDIKCTFKMMVSSLAGLPWEYISEFEETPFKPYTGLISSNSLTLNQASNQVPDQNCARLECPNTKMNPRDETRLYLSIVNDLGVGQVRLITNTPYVWERFNFTNSILNGCSQLELNEDRSVITLKLDSQIAQISLQTIDTPDTENFHFPIWLEMVNGKTEKYRNMTIISMTNFHPEEPSDGLTRFIVGGRVWVLDFDTEVKSYTVRTAVFTASEADRFKTQSIQDALRIKISEILGKNVRLLNVGWNPEGLYEPKGNAIIGLIYHYIED